MSWSDKINQFAQSAINKSKEVAEVTKLNSRISTLNTNKKSLYTQVGEYVLGNDLLKEDASVAAWALQLEEIVKEIEENQKKIREVKNIQVCPQCGAELTRESRFCAKCGAVLTVPEEAVTEPATVSEEVAAAETPETAEQESVEAEKTAEATEPVEATDSVETTEE